jgi:low temperature requirement protein LtrA
MCGPVVQITTKYYAGQKSLAVIVCHFKKSNCNPYFIVIMITVLIMNVIFRVVNFKTRNYFVIFYYTERLLQVIYVQWRAKKSDTSNSK